MNSNGKLVVVTGGTRGIGRGLVERLSAARYKVVFTYQSSAQAAEELEHAAKANGRTVKAYRCDANSMESVKAFVDETIKEHGSPYALINNVGITRDRLLATMSPEDWHSVIDANLHSTFYATNGFLRAMMEQGDGCIIQMSSVSGLKGNRGQTNYSSTKAALIAFSRSLATEVARFNIRVNAVAPGFIATELTEKIPAARLNDMVKNIPLKRLGNVDEVAALVEFLVSKDAAYITGQTFVVDGGITV